MFSDGAYLLPQPSWVLSLLVVTGHQLQQLLQSTSSNETECTEIRIQCYNIETWKYSKKTISSTNTVNLTVKSLLKRRVWSNGIF